MYPNVHSSTNYNNQDMETTQVPRLTPHGRQRQAWNAEATAAVTKKPVCKHRSLSTLPLLGACAARHCQDPVIQGQLPQRTHGAPQAVATSCWPLSLQACPASVPLPPQAWMSQSPLSSCYFNPILSGRGTDALRWPTRRGRANPKLNPRSCTNKEEKGKFLPAASGASD